jgi:hypothetical protein
LSYNPQSTPDLITVELYCATGPGEAPLLYPHNRFNLRADQEGTVWKRLPTTKGENRHDSMCLGDLIVYMVGDHTVNNLGAATGCLTSHNNWRSGTVYSMGLTSANWFPDGRVNNFWTIATTDQLYPDGSPCDPRSPDEHSNNDYLEFSTAGQGDTYRLVSAGWQRRLRLTGHAEQSNKSHDEMSHDSSSSCATDVDSLSDRDFDNSDNSVEYTRSVNLTGMIQNQIKDEIREFLTHFSTKGILGKESQSSPRRFGPALNL